MTDESRRDRLQDAQLAALRTVAPLLASIRPLALQLLEADMQVRALLRILDSTPKETP